MTRTVSILKTAAIAFAFFVGMTLVVEYAMGAPSDGPGFDGKDLKGVLDLVAVPVAITLAIVTRRQSA